MGVIGMPGDIKSILDFRDKVMLAPMVRIGTLPARLVALDYGADLVYTEEIIDLKMLRCKRIENAMLRTVDFIMNDETIAFRTCEHEKGQVVFQIGTSDADRALKVAKMVEHDVAAFDLNMGCPKEYSTKGGCGAALLSQPENVKHILTTLVKNLSIPVTCKMRVLPTMEETVTFVKMVEATGVAAIAVHGRLREERPRHSCRLDTIRAIAAAVSIPIIANGGSKHIIKKFEDIEKFRESCGAASVMLARAAQWDPSIFRAAGPIPLHDTCKRYVKYALQYDSTPTNIKYNVQQLLHQEMETPHGQRLLAAGTMFEISSIWDLDAYYEEKSREWTAFKQAQAALHEPTRRTLPDGMDIWEQEFRFYKREYPRNITPKFKLDQWARKMGIEKPLFETEQNVAEQYFYSVLTIEGTKYASTLWDKSKKAAEQAAAAVFMTVHNMHDGRKEWHPQTAQADGQTKTEKEETTTQQSEKLEPIVQTSTPTLQPPASPSKCKTSPCVDIDVKSEHWVQSAQGFGHVEDEGAGEGVIGGRLDDGMIKDVAMVEDVVNSAVSEKEDRAATDDISEAATGRVAYKRSASLTELIDNMIEKQIRLNADDPGDKQTDSSLIDTYLANEMEQNDAGLIKSETSSEVSEEET